MFEFFFSINESDRIVVIHSSISEPAVTGFSHGRKMLFSLSDICNLRLGTSVNELITMTIIHEQDQEFKGYGNIYLAKERKFHRKQAKSKQAR